MFAVLLARSRRDATGLAWAAGFAASAIGAALGAHSHGFPDFVSRRTHDIIWTATLMFIGLAGLLFALAALLTIGVGAALGAGLTAPAAAAYVVAISRRPSFATAGMAYAAALVLLIVCALFLGIRPPGPGAWMLGSVALTALGVGIQRAKLGLHPSFNHNDVYHVVQLAALYLLYRAAAGS